MHRWVYILASPEVAKNYYFRATLKGHADRKITSFCQVSSLNENFRGVIEKGTDTFKIDVKTIQKVYRLPNNYIDYQIEVTDMKEEAKDDNEESGISDD